MASGPSASTSRLRFTLTKLAARQMVDTVGDRGRGQHLVALGQHDPDQLRGLRRGQGGARSDDPQHRPRAGPPGAGERHRRRRRGDPRRSTSSSPTTTCAGSTSAGTPMGRPGEPEDIACAVLYLVSDASSWVTGKVFEIDGGAEASGHLCSCTAPRTALTCPPCRVAAGQRGRHWPSTDQPVTEKVESEARGPRSLPFRGTGDRCPSSVCEVPRFSQRRGARSG
jgi:hypothetical protein